MSDSTQKYVVNVCYTQGSAPSIFDYIILKIVDRLPVPYGNESLENILIDLGFNKDIHSVFSQSLDQLLSNGHIISNLSFNQGQIPAVSKLLYLTRDDLELSSSGKALIKGSFDHSSQNKLALVEFSPSYSSFISISTIISSKDADSTASNYPFSDE